MMYVDNKININIHTSFHSKKSKRKIFHHHIKPTMADMRDVVNKYVLKHAHTHSPLTFQLSLVSLTACG